MRIAVTIRALPVTALPLIANLPIRWVDQAGALMNRL